MFERLKRLTYQCFAMTGVVLISLSVYLPMAIVADRHGYHGSSGFIGLVTTVFIFFSLSMVFAFIATAIHEWGHAIAARKHGWDVRQIVIMGVAWHYKKRRFQKPNGHAATNDIAGWVDVSPPYNRLVRTSEEFWIILWGPLADFISSLLFLVTGIVLWRMTGNPLWTFAIGFGVYSLLSGVFNLIPVALGSGWTSDGRKLLALLPLVLEQRRLRR